MKLSGKNILVTGGSGFIGSHIVEKLLEKKIRQIIILDNLECGTKKNIKDALKDDRVKFVKGDIRDFKKLLKITKDIDVIFHEAALRHTQCTQNPREGNEVLADGTFNIFDAAVKNNVQKVIFASSASVYGDPLKMPMKETDNFNDKTFYGAAKIYNERLAIAFRDVYKLNCIGLRNFNVYGPRMDTLGVYTQVLIRWLQKIQAGEAPVIHGDGKQSLDFVYVGDVAEANILAAESEVNEGFFNVGSGTETTLLELLNLLIKVTDSKVKPEFKKAPPHSLANRRKADTTKSEQLIGFKTQTSLESGLKYLVDWYNSFSA